MSTLSRRSALCVAGVVAVAVAGCTGDSDVPAPSAAPSSTAPPPPDPQLADLTAERRLLAAYDAAIKAHPDLATRLRPIRAAHAEHAASLVELTGAARGAGSPPALPAEPTAVIAALRELEVAAARARAASCITAEPSRAPVLGSIAAAEACHAEVLA